MQLINYFEGLKIKMMQKPLFKSCLIRLFIWKKCQSLYSLKGLPREIDFLVDGTNDFSFCLRHSVSKVPGIMEGNI